MPNHKSENNRIFIKLYVPAFSSSCCLFSSGRSDVAERVLGITCQQQDSKYGTENKQEGNKETNDGSDNQVTQR
ncbi:hypothetical protein T12_8780 [Trichinella patagoniensis]|uniref:Uncharacterized protein n=1 Tax=Trichinella patagoniensis TaxID=990121 RepID=A0A0V0Z7M8_9BILA|nr:hypothetical protein T12_8780 [Trichinella patagoniensis]